MALIINVFNDSAMKRIPAKKIKETVVSALAGEKVKDAAVNVILLDDKAIKELNVKYLKHDYATDVISFSLNEEGEELEGEIYISADTASVQAKEYKVSLTNELTRLAVHGALHLAGYDDKTDKERSAMRALETKYMLGQ